MRSIRGRTGRWFLVRPLQRDDDTRLSEAYDRLSPESRYKRFLAIKPSLTTNDVRYLTDVDANNHVALAITLATQPDRIVGVARFVRTLEDPQVAEFSIVLGDEFQREGVGAALLRMLADDAVALGVERFEATVLAENVGAHRLINGIAVGHPEWTHHGTVDEVEFVLPHAAVLAA